MDAIVVTKAPATPSVVTVPRIPVHCRWTWLGRAWLDLPPAPPSHHVLVPHALERDPDEVP